MSERKLRQDPKQMKKNEKKEEESRKPNSFRLKYPPELQVQLEAEAVKYRQLRNELGMAFRSVQDEAYKHWADMMRAFEEGDIE